MRERSHELEATDAVVAVVTFEPPSKVARFAQVERMPLVMMSDPTRRAYAAFGLGRGGFADLVSWRTIEAYVVGALRGRWPRLPRGDVSQLGGDFVLDRRGVLVLVHRSEDPADRPSVESLLAAVRSVEQ